MTMTVRAFVNDELIRALTIANTTKKMSGVNTYHWVYTCHDRGAIASLLAAKEGTIDHVMEDGAMNLIAKVAADAALTESDNPTTDTSVRHKVETIVRQMVDLAAHGALTEQYAYGYTQALQDALGIAGPPENVPTN